MALSWSTALFLRFPNFECPLNDGRCRSPDSHYIVTGIRMKSLVGGAVTEILKDVEFFAEFGELQVMF